MEGEKGGDKVSMETAWGILEEVVDLLENRAEVLDNSICCSLQTFVCVNICFNVPITK